MSLPCQAILKHERASSKLIVEGVERDAALADLWKEIWENTTTNVSIQSELTAALGTERLGRRRWEEVSVTRSAEVVRLENEVRNKKASAMRFLFAYWVRLELRAVLVSWQSFVIQSQQSMVQETVEAAIEDAMEEGIGELSSMKVDVLKMLAEFLCFMKTRALVTLGEILKQQWRQATLGGLWRLRQATAHSRAIDAASAAEVMAPC